MSEVCRTEKREFNAKLMIAAADDRGLPGPEASAHHRRPRQSVRAFRHVLADAFHQRTWQPPRREESEHGRVAADCRYVTPSASPP
jgi:hypothetical protein